MGVISANKSVCVGHGIKLEEKIILLISLKFLEKYSWINFRELEFPKNYGR